MRAELRPVAPTTASLDIFRLGREDVLEQSEKRLEYVQFRKQRCITVLWQVGRFVLARLPVESDLREAYVEAVLSINEGYFEAREFEDRVEGRFHKFDEDAERRVRETAADGLSDAVVDLRAMVAAHENALDGLPADQREEVGPRLFGATKRVLGGGWMPTLLTYYHALDPGEYIAEGVERRNRRIHGEGRRPGVSDLLRGPLFEALTPDDLEAIKGIDWRAPGQPARFVNYIEEHFEFVIQRR